MFLIQVIACQESPFAPRRLKLDSVGPWGRLVAITEFVLCLGGRVKLASEMSCNRDIDYTTMNRSDCSAEMTTETVFVASVTPQRTDKSIDSEITKNLVITKIERFW